MTNLKLQKIIFFTYVDYYRKYNEELFEDQFESWVYGPVIPELYKNYALIYEAEDLDYIDDKFDKQTKKFLNKIVFSYGTMNVSQLISLTHDETAWKKARQGLYKNEAGNKKMNIKKTLKK